MLPAGLSYIGRVDVTVLARSRKSRNFAFGIASLPPRHSIFTERYGGALDGSFATRSSCSAATLVKQLGYRERAHAIADDIDVVRNSAGNVTFNPRLRARSSHQLVGTRCECFRQTMKRPALIHVSTASSPGNAPARFGRRSGSRGLSAQHYCRAWIHADPESGLRKLAERVREEARDAVMLARFRDLARKRLNEENRDADDPDTLGLAVARERKVCTRTRLTDLGMERSAWWGWPNIYTYTKSLGEQLVAAELGLFVVSFAPVSSSRRWLSFPRME